MSIILDPAQPVSYRPREDGPTYLLRPPTVADRNKYRHALRAEGAQFHRHLDLLDIARKALDRLLPETDDNVEARAESIATIEEYRQMLQGRLDEREADRTEETNQAVIDALEFPNDLVRLLDALRAGDYELRIAFADNATYWDTAGLEAARLFLIGWEGLGRFKRALTGPTEATLQQIEPSDLAMIAVKIEQMMQPSEARTKNSDSLPSGRSAETKSSSAGRTTRRNGHSADATATA